jgi:O-antigen/teichoic acid export membrane protein
MGGEGRFTLGKGVTLRQHAARGTLVNGAFTLGLTVLGQLRGIVLVAFLAPEDFGIWGILLITLGTLAWLKQLGIADKYLQQDEEDQQLAFQKAFTLELAVNGMLFAASLATVPLMALAYGRPELLLPGFALCLLIPAGQLQVPFWVLYRRLEYARQRALMAIDPVLGFAVTIALAIAGAGYWSIIVGMLVGAWAAGIVGWRTSPYPLRLRYDRGTLREYVRFSGPLFVASLGGIVFAQGSIFFGEHALGLAGAGAITLAAQISQLAQRVDDVVGQTLYPVICSVADRRDVLYETFTKSNRIAVMWAMPFGLGLALFADDLVTFVLGEQWAEAIVVLQAVGVAAALLQLGFNWSSYMRAMAWTRPIAVNSLLQAAVFLASVPLLYAWGLAGFAVQLGLVTVVNLAARTYFLTRIFDGFAMVGHAARCLLPSLPALAAVLLLRTAERGPRGLGTALAELALYVAVTVVATWAFERSLLREALGYLRRRGSAPVVPA